VDLEYFVQMQLLLGLRIICVRRSCLLDLEYFRAPTFCIGRRHFLIDADILGRQHFA
jgi:hypothetical protein